MASYRILPDRSRVWIDATSSVHPIHTEATGIGGHLEIDVDDEGVNLASAPRGALTFDVERLRSGNPLEDRELRRRIDARRHPTIDGELVEMRATDRPGHFEVSGDVTFRGVTQRCTDEMEVAVVDGTTIRLAGSSTFDVRAFGMEPPRILMLRVHPEVTVRVEILASVDD